MESGFNCLPTTIPIYLLLGNHDLDNSSSLKLISDVDNSESIPKPCHILNKENEIIKSMNLIRPQNEDKKMVIYKLINDVLIIMIDTTIYDIDHNHTDHPSLDCYNKELSSENTLTKLFEIQKTEVETIISSIENKEDLRHVIIIGHHPLFCLNEKNDEIIEVELSNSYSLFYNTIFSELNKENQNIKYYYLCADYHNYQVGEIVLKSINHDNDNDFELLIHQEIVGTGGTELDNIITKKNLGIKKNNNSEFSVSYKIKKTVNSFGFLKCEQKDDSIIFSFIKSDKKKTIKRTPSISINNYTRKRSKSSSK